MNIIVCEDDFGADVFCFAKSAGWNASAILSPSQIKSLPLQNLGQVENYTSQEDDVFCIAIKDIERRIEVVSFLKSKNAKFATIIHPTCEISNHAEISEGVIITPFCLISANTSIGEFTIIESNTQIGHDAKIGNFSNIGSHCDITGFCKVENRCDIGNGCALIPNVKITSDVKIKANSTLVSSKRKAGSY